MVNTLQLSPIFFFSLKNNKKKIKIKSYKKLTRKEGSVMGRSRSASFIMAYLLFSDDSLDVSSALALLNQCRACVQPNSGFMLQLGLYFSMGCPVELDKEAAYYRWLERRGGGRKSGSWEDMRGKISARARKMDEERKL